MADLYRTLREEALEANLEIPRNRLAIYTWGNASAFDRARGVFAIKPSGVPYERLRAEDMALVDLDGKVLGGGGRPSSDTDTHRVLYRAFGVAGGIGGITHTHSPYAVAWAQAGKPVPLLGTTHADHAAHAVPCTEMLTADAVSGGYELATGRLIADTFSRNGIDPALVPMALVAGHGPFTWGKTAALSVYHSAVLEEICKMALLTLRVNPDAAPLPGYIVRKHWERKHGPAAYYGQG